MNAYIKFYCNPSWAPVADNFISPDFKKGLTSYIIQTHTYGPQVREFKMGSINFQYVPSGFSKHINTEAHPLLKKKQKHMKSGGERTFSAVMYQKWDLPKLRKLTGSWIMCLTKTRMSKPQILAGNPFCSSHLFKLFLIFKVTLEKPQTMSY